MLAAYQRKVNGNEVPKVVFDALVGLLGESNVPLEPVFVGAGLQHWNESDIATQTNNEIVPEVKADAAPVEETWRKLKLSKRLMRLQLA